MVNAALMTTHKLAELALWLHFQTETSDCKKDEIRVNQQPDDIN